MVTMHLIQQGRVKEVYAREGETILDFFKREHIVIQAPCNGRGTCMSCRIRVNGEAEERLACQTKVEDQMKVELLHPRDQMAVLTDYIEESGFQRADVEKGHEAQDEIYVASIDLGTTTVVVQLGVVEQRRGVYRVIQTVSGLNPQSIYGADVISRITAALQGDDKELQLCIVNFLWESIEGICQNQGIHVSELAEIVIGGNTTMLHLLRGYSVQGLSAYPFTPVSLAMETISYAKFKGDKQEGAGPKVTLLPGISAFVGSDITAGLYAIGMHDKEEISLFVDLGTNGELAIGNRDRILVTSTAAGPAFEGGNLSCGVGSISGAVSEVVLKKRYAIVRTIDNQPPIGLCGTGALELLAELLGKGMIDTHGSFVEESHRSQGYLLNTRGMSVQHSIVMTQEDIRALQLAKGAIRAGMEVLMKEYGVTSGQIASLYLAGGMGFALNMEKACAIGLIPQELKEKVRIVGNSCLGGCVKYQCAQVGKKPEIRRRKLEEIAASVEHIQLAENEDFISNYLEYMEF